jgi:hypothetical protein
MIRSGRIPPILNRICDAQVPTALLVTYDGELLGTSNVLVHPMFHGQHYKDPEAFGTLLADIAMEYSRLGEEYSQDNKSKLDCLLLQLEGGIAAAVACPQIACFVLAIGTTNTPLGLLRARLHALATHVQESMSLLTSNMDMTMTSSTTAAHTAGAHTT